MKSEIRKGSLMINQKSKLSVGIAMLFVTILLVTAFLGIATRQMEECILDATRYGMS